MNEVGTGELRKRVPVQDSWNRIARAGQLEQDSQGRTAGTGQPEKTVEIVQPDRKQRQTAPNMTARSGS
jgi:hypothetical protein